MLTVTIVSTTSAEVTIRVKLRATFQSSVRSLVRSFDWSILRLKVSRSVGQKLSKFVVVFEAFKIKVTNR